MGSHGSAITPAGVTVLAAQGDGIRIDLDIASLLGYILIGLVVGLLARLLVPGRTSIGLIGTIVIGVIGAIVGGWLAGEIFRETQGVDWIASILVAVVLVLLLQAGARRRPMWRRPMWGRRY